MSDADRQRGWEVAESILGCFDSYRLAAVTPIAFEIAQALAAARAEGRREAIGKCAELLKRLGYPDAAYTVQNGNTMRDWLNATAPAAPPESL